MKTTKKKTSKKDILKRILSLLVIYITITGMLLFAKPGAVTAEYKNKSCVDRYYADEIGPDRAIVINDPLKSGVARIEIIGNAKETLDIAYFSMQKGETPFLFFAALLEAADRGVQVNLLLDGMFHGMKKDLKDIVYTFAAHPNMDLRFYEPLNLLMPWTMNNRMHDKFIVADDKIAIIGGRNIGDKYFAPDWYDDVITNDRDIVIINFEEDSPDSVLSQLSDYYDLLWNHKYTKPSIKKLSAKQRSKGLKMGQDLKKHAKGVKEANKALFEDEIDLMALSAPTNKITLITNPIERFSKEPTIWYEITQLMNSAKESVFIQSPYVIPSRQMTTKFLNKDTFEDIEVSVLTNSLASSPNVLAYSGYLKHKEMLVDNNINIYELQSENSTHAKSFVIDNDLTLIGSFNVDPRSVYLSTESMVVIHSPEIVKEFGEVTQQYVDHSLLVGPDYKYIPKDGVEEPEVKMVKIVVIKFLSYINRFFEFLL